MHWLGTDSGNSPWYLFYSGLFGVLTIAAGLFWNGWVNYRRHNCRMRWCPRLGRHEYTDPHGVKRALCYKHHPDVTHKQLTRERLHLYLGDRPGRG